MKNHEKTLKRVTKNDDIWELKSCSKPLGFGILDFSSCSKPFGFGILGTLEDPGYKREDRTEEGDRKITEALTFLEIVRKIRVQN